MSLATLTGSKVSVIEPEGTTAIHFLNLDAALSALVKHQWQVVGALDKFTVLFQHKDDNVVQHVSQLQMTARLAERVADRRAVSRLSIEANQKRKTSSHEK
jgi:hypothetical protein